MDSEEIAAANPRVQLDRYHADPETGTYLYRTVFVDALFEADSYGEPMTDRIIVAKRDLADFVSAALSEAGYRGTVSFEALATDERTEDAAEEGESYYDADVHLTLMGPQPRVPASHTTIDAAASDPYPDPLDRQENT